MNFEEPSTHFENAIDTCAAGESCAVDKNSPGQPYLQMAWKAAMDQADQKQIQQMANFMIAEAKEKADGDRGEAEEEMEEQGFGGF